MGWPTVTDTLRRKLDVARQLNIHTFLAPWAEVSAYAARVKYRAHSSPEKKTEGLSRSISPVSSCSLKAVPLPVVCVPQPKSKDRHAGGPFS